jgi:hypothetical protein
MPLPTNVVSEFAKITNDNQKQKTESTIQGTVEVDGERTYVKLDGSKTRIPVRTGTTTASVKSGDRVTVMIKNHTAIVTGNLTAPSAQQNDLEEVEQTVKELDLGDVKIKLDSLEAFTEDLSVGSRNLYLGTRNFDGNKWTNLDQWETWDPDGFGYREYGRYGAWLGLGQYVEVKAGETYTFSFYASGNENAEITIYTSQDHTETSPGSLYIGRIPDAYTRYHFTFKVNYDCTIYPRVENMTDNGWIQIYGLKFEKGNVPTDWTPAPEDVELSVEEASKVATKFMEYNAESGLQLGNKTSGVWSGFRSQITSAAFNILNEAGEVLAHYGASLIELGRNSVDAVIKLCGGMGQIKYNSDENYLDISSDNIRLKGTEMSSVEAGYTDGSGVKRSSAVHTSPTEVQIRSGINSSGSWNDCSIRVTPDEIKTSGFIYDNDTGGYYESFVEGTSGIWTYRKWKSGKVELWGEYYVSSKSCSAALGNWYRTTSFTIGNFPFTVYNPKLVANYESTGYGALLWPTTSTTTNSPPEYYLIRPTSGNVNGTIYIHVVGEWTN